MKYKVLKPHMLLNYNTDLAMALMISCASNPNQTFTKEQLGIEFATKLLKDNIIEEC